MEENYKTFHQEEGMIVIDNLFEEALSYRVSSKCGGHGTTKEE
jgi:hypothetical protein